ncbi:MULTISPECIES: MerR family transcriptional regulator [unclassified Micromonospora]|uniref:helix-turn-helix domain-containing protein n=1 Tax=unclassified Micromonospora TaxID=2617518 RepID=UPI0010345BF9|nr:MULTISPECIES: MerR family transcriptional regulator [unclassified Micromonospora]QKW15126.1 MerR family transcriptional regulator [Verrucosispora sp. NA02020]TBL45060.1 MerR family transcriptional regulator [Verrucosispora sp. SN26_14.1]
MNEWLSIGDVARRTGLSVSAIRFYADEGIVAPTGYTAAGYRCYDARGVAALELVRTLRDLGAGLDEIRRLLADEITVRDLARAHLALVERQMGHLRTRRAVLRAVVRQDSEAGQVSLVHRLASMSDDDREQLVEEFWAEVTDGLDLREFVDYLRPWRPRLPEDPTGEQLDAWIELADLVRDPGFRQAVREFFGETFASTADRERADPAAEADVAAQVEILAQARAAAEAGVPVDSREARQVATRWVALAASRSGDQDLTEVRRQIAAADPGPQVSRHVALLGRYHSLTATINGTAQPVGHAPASTWLHAAVAALT